MHAQSMETDLEDEAPDNDTNASHGEDDDMTKTLSTDPAH